MSCLAGDHNPITASIEITHAGEITILECCETHYRMAMKFLKLPQKTLALNARKVGGWGGDKFKGMFG